MYPHEYNKVALRACMHGLYIYVFAIQGSKNEYLVLWKGYPMEAATWEPSENIEAELLRFAILI